MKTSFPALGWILSMSAVVIVSLLAFPGVSQARDHNRSYYFAHPRSGYTLSFGIGYAGTGYYYGPPGASYYYEGPGVIYYRDRRSIPREYSAVDESYRIHSVEAAVQRALALRGYNPGPIDGEIGPMSRRAIARYQEDNGLRVTGAINANLLSSLDL